MEYILLAAALFSLAGLILLIVLLVRLGSTHTRETELRSELRATRAELRATLQDATQNLSESVARDRRHYFEAQELRLRQLEELQAKLSQEVHREFAAQDARFSSFALQNDSRMETLRQVVDTRMAELREDHNRRLDDMRKTVDERLQESLESKISQSFRLVSERLEQVYKGLGEVQGLASGVGDLKKVLTNVKTKGILGELQLGAILQETLSPDQYAENVATRPGRSERVEFAIRLPGSDGVVYLPIDAKFPSEPYFALEEAYETGDPEAIRTASQVLTSRLKACARDIHTKYVEPPYTTDFAIMFLPFEGLYAAAVRSGMIETLQREYRVNIAGPSTISALLNSLQLGFRNLAIQKRSAEVWDILISVKGEFDKFSEVLALTDQRLTQAQSELNKLVGVRTRQIQRKLDLLSAPESAPVFPEES